MKNFALQQPSEEWMILEFSQLGFIGKRFCFSQVLILRYVLLTTFWLKVWWTHAKNTLTGQEVSNTLSSDTNVKDKLLLVCVFFWHNSEHTECSVNLVKQRGFPATNPRQPMGVHWDKTPERYSMFWGNWVIQSLSLPPAIMWAKNAWLHGMALLTKGGRIFLDFSLLIATLPLLHHAMLLGRSPVFNRGFWRYTGGSWRKEKGGKFNFC